MSLNLAQVSTHKSDRSRVGHACSHRSFIHQSCHLLHIRSPPPYYRQYWFLHRFMLQSRAHAAHAAPHVRRRAMHCRPRPWQRPGRESTTSLARAGAAASRATHGRSTGAASVRGAVVVLDHAVEALLAVAPAEVGVVHDHVAIDLGFEVGSILGIVIRSSST